MAANWITSKLFGCWHVNMSWPQFGLQRCNDCGARRTYDWKTMTTGSWESPERDDRFRVIGPDPTRAESAYRRSGAHPLSPARVDRRTVAKRLLAVGSNARLVLHSIFSRR